MEIFKRYVMLCVGLLIVAFGVAFSILADLGTSPISCPPYVASMLCPLTVGEATIVMHCIFILIQMALLRKDYDWVQLMQLPVAFAFGYMTDFACWCIADVPCPNYLMQVVWCLVGIVLVGVGVAFEVVAGVVTLAVMVVVMMFMFILIMIVMMVLMLMCCLFLCMMCLGKSLHFQIILSFHDLKDLLTGQFCPVGCNNGGLWIQLLNLIHAKLQLLRRGVLAAA